jgi:Mlc titration factor MtfA (ptsG expression regulator)
MFGAKERRRRNARARPFADAWRSILEESVLLYRRLPLADRAELHGHIQILLAEKRFEGADGLEVSDRMKLVIAAQAAVLLLHRSTGFFPKLVSVLVYPAEYAVQEEIEAEDGLIEEVDEARIGESWQLGTLVLSWEDVESDLESDVQNVVLHEFAHQLDAESGDTNGAPILTDQGLRSRWADVMSGAYERLIGADEAGEETLLDPYGTEDPAEFFAVATEAFFLIPNKLVEEEPDLYAILSEFFRQDPARW